MKNLIAIIVIFVGFFSLIASEEPIKNVRSILTHKEFRESGLEKLSDQELLLLSGHLYGWKKVEAVALEPIKSRVLVQKEAVFGNERLVEIKRKKSDEPKMITSRIVGDFRGWSGKGRFILENGQVWKQTDKKKFYLKRTNPEVEIRKGVLGGYFFSLIGSGSKCKVQRVK